MAQSDIEVAGPLHPIFQDPKVVRENIKLFRRMQKELLDPEVDIDMIQGKPFTNKSGWNVLNGYFGCITKPIDSWKRELPDNEFMMVVVVEASGMGRKPVSRSGYCSSIEMKAKHHDKDYSSIESHCHSMAETRAVGRASGAFFMVADVSAEEVGDSPGFTQPKGGGAGNTMGSIPSEKACMCNREHMKLDADGKHCENCKGKFTDAQLKLLQKK